MNHIVVITFIIFLASCSNQKNELEAVYSPLNTNISISITLTPAHLYLAEYNRILKIKNNGKEIYKKVLFIDSGGYSNTNLYLDKNHYIVLDINGDLYRINKDTLKVSVNNYWKYKKPPVGFIGAFDFTERKYNFIPREMREEKEMGLLKGG